MILRAPDNPEILFKPVFGNTVLKQSVLYCFRIKKSVVIEIVANDDTAARIRREIQEDDELKVLPIRFSAQSGADALPLNRIFDSSQQAYDINTEEDLALARSAMKKSIIDNCPTLVAKHINKRVSLPLSGYLAQWKTSPNLITLIAILFGVLGAWLAANTHLIWGALCFQINSILDGCDGEVARLNVRQSNFGKKFDIYGDYFTSVLAIIGVSTGAYVYAQKVGVLILSLSNVIFLITVGMIWIAAIMLKMTPENFEEVEALCHKRLKNPQTTADQVARAFLLPSQKDFYFTVLFVLAICGQYVLMDFFLVFVTLAWAFLSLYTLASSLTPAERR